MYKYNQFRKYNWTIEIYVKNYIIKLNFDLSLLRTLKKTFKTIGYTYLYTQYLPRYLIIKESISSIHCIMKAHSYHACPIVIPKYLHLWPWWPSIHFNECKIYVTHIIYYINIIYIKDNYIDQLVNINTHLHIKLWSFIEQYCSNICPNWLNSSFGISLYGVKYKY